MERNHQELPPNKPVQFVCDYRGEQSAIEMADNQSLQSTELEQISEQESYTEPTETIHVTLDDAELLKSEISQTDMLCVEPLQDDMFPAEPFDHQEQETQNFIYPSEEPMDGLQQKPEGFPLWKRNNCPSRLFYPERQNITEETQMQDQDEKLKLSPVRPFRLFCGMMVLAAAFLGVVCFCMFGSTPLVQDSSQIHTFLTPVMMQNPEPFSSVSEANHNMILQASVWRVVTLNGSIYRATDDKGRVVVPGEDVEKACTELFGSACRLAVKHPTEETFFTYDRSSNTYRVLPQSSQSAQAVNIKHIKKENGVVIVTVETVAADEQTPLLYRYILEFDGLSGEPYLTSVMRVT